jgi:hypothetical protein
MSETTALRLPGAARPTLRGDDEARAASRQFLFLIALATAVPWVGLPFLLGHADHPTTHQLETGILFIGSGVHVAASYFFYLDPAARGTVRRHRWRFLYVPAILVVGTAVLFALAPERLRFSALIAYLAWQTYHYMRQNIGVFAFVTKARRAQAPTALERRAIAAAGYAAILAMIAKATPYQKTPLNGAGDTLQAASVLVYLVAAVLLLAALAQARTQDPIRLCGLVASVLFFIPVLIYRDPLSATLSYAVAHGFQYLVFMWFVTRGRDHARASRLQGVGIAIALGGGFLLDRMSHGGGPAFAGAVFGAYLGLVMIHFVLDAGVWRLRDPAQREYMKERFAFL